eukprot:3443407-Amphidinium_carterae.1
MLGRMEQVLNEEADLGSALGRQVAVGGDPCTGKSLQEFGPPRKAVVVDPLSATMGVEALEAD